MIQDAEQNSELIKKWRACVAYMYGRGYWATWTELTEDGPQEGIDYDALMVD